jgi:hypothetical protein
MDYVKQIKKIDLVNFFTFAIGKNFTFAKYRNLKRKPPKVETKPQVLTLAASYLADDGG